ncbi:hypothetical protein EV177_000232 [Coemansia sp. RSA 1804]|nr:hypothetical protein EV177_000232 [Coemansia sp. RSA 1804]
MHTAAPVAPAAAAPPMAPPMAARPSSPGLLSQMATTAAGVALGSAAGRVMADSVSGFFGGSSEGAAQAPPQQQQQVQQSAYDQSSGFQQSATSCDMDAKNFTRCLESTNNDMSACQYYLDALKSCQAFANSRTF